MRCVLSAVTGPCGGALLLLLLLSFSARAATEEDVNKQIDEIKMLVLEANYEKALHRVETAQKQSLTSEQEVTLWLYEGILSYELGDDSRAEAALRRALTRQCDATLPVRTSPKITAPMERLRKSIATCAHPPAASPAPSAVNAKPVSPAPAPSSLRKLALIPALAGGAIAVAGGGFYIASRANLSQLRNDDSHLTSLKDVQATASRGQTFQTLGVCLAGVGVAGLATSAVMYLLGAPPKASASLGMGTDGTSAFVYGRWP